MKMMSDFLYRRAAVLIIVATTCLSALVPPIHAQEASKDSNVPDLADYLSLCENLVIPDPAKKDPKTGLVVSGKNHTTLIQGLSEINGRTISELEIDMRPGANSEVGSEKGFLGSEEKLRDVLTADNKYVVDKLELTHQILAKHLHAMGTIGYWQYQHGKRDAEFVYNGRRFRVKMVTSRGFQLSPFLDGTKSASDITVHNLDSDKVLEYSLLVPYMIERYGFYEGKGTTYRVEPEKVVELFDFLKVRLDKK